MSDIKQVIVCRKDLNLRKGKLAAQVGHASMAFMTSGYDIRWKTLGTEQIPMFGCDLTLVELEWLTGLHKKIVVGINSEQELLDIVEKATALGIKAKKIIDQGLTEFHGIATLTCAAFGPAPSHVLDPLTGHLQLL